MYLFDVANLIIPKIRCYFYVNALINHTFLPDKSSINMDYAGGKVELIKKIKRYFKITKGVFVFSYRKNSFSIPFEEIYYIEKSGRRAYLYSKNKEYVFNMTLSEIWKQLDSGMFVSIHPSCIVNLFYVREIVRDELILKNGDKLFVSKKYCQEVKKRHLRFIKEKG